MKKLLLFTLIWLYPVISFSAIDERKTDIYFANGIKTSDAEAKENAEKILEPAIKKGLFESNETKMYTYIGKFDYAYNNTHDMFIDEDGGFDLFESFLQKLSCCVSFDINPRRACCLKRQSANGCALP